MEIEDLDDDFFRDVEASTQSASAAPAAAQAPVPRRRHGPVRVSSPRPQEAPRPTPAVSSVFDVFGSKASEPRPFTPVSEAEAVEPAKQESTVAAGAPTTKPVDRATALLQHMEQKAKSQKAGAQGRPSRSATDTAERDGGGSRVGEGRRAGEAGPSYNAQGAAPPVLNDAKAAFAKRRLLQTLLGGPQLLTPGGCAPPALVFSQMLVWLLPAAVGVPLSVHVHVMPSRIIAPAVSAAAVLLALTCLHLARWMPCAARVAPGEQDIGRKASMLVEEDELDFQLCTGPGLAFLVPPRGWMTVAYGLVSAALVGAATAYLAPTVAARALGVDAAPTAAVYAYLVSGWLAVSLAAYSLNAQTPPEPNRYSAVENGGFAGPPSRALHVLLVMLPALVAPDVCDTPATRLLGSVFPLLWGAGSLPPADCLAEWLLEQVHVHLHGGSTAGSPRRLAVLICASWVLVAATCALLLQQGLPRALALACPCSFLLSHDLAPPPLAPHHRAQTWRGRDGSPLERLLRRGGGSVLGLIWRGSIAVTLVVVPLVLPQDAFAAGLQHQGTHSLLRAAVLVAWVLCRGGSALQRPYLGFLLANPIRRAAPGTCGGVMRGLRLLHVATARGGAILLVAVVVMHSHALEPERSASAGAAAPMSLRLLVGVVSTTRALRKAWQAPAGALTEASVAFLLGHPALVAPAFCPAGLVSSSWWCGLGVCEQWLVVGWVLQVVWEAAAKMHFVATLAVTSWTDRRQRARLARVYLALLAVGFPVALVILSASAMLSAPLLPVLGIPLFIVGFPRPKRHWPAGESATAAAAASVDAAYYKHLVPAAARGLLAAIGEGAVGGDVRGGEIFLLRRDSLLLMVQVLERGCGWAHLLCKGLELQETSCHHQEAAAVEQVLDSALGDCTLASAPPALPWCNPWLLSSLEPLTKIPATLYSLADISLTGILDRPERADQVPRVLAYALLWLLRRRERTSGPAPAAWFDFAAIDELEGYGSLAGSAGARRWDAALAAWSAAIGLWPPAPTLDVEPATHAHAVDSPGGIAVAPRGGGRHGSEEVGAGRKESGGAAVPVAMKKEDAGGTFGFTGRWRGHGSADTLSRENTRNDGSSTRSEEGTRAVASLAATPLEEAGEGAGAVGDVEMDDLDDLLQEFDGGEATVAGRRFGSEVGVDADALLEELNAETLPVPSGGVHAHPDGGTLHSDGARSRNADQAAVLRCWLGACWGLLEDWGHLSSRSGLEHTTMVFAGELPRSSHAAWIKDAARAELLELVLMAFRYSVKFCYDTCLYGGEESQDHAAESDQEDARARERERFIESFTEYDDKWYLGLEDSPGWAAAVESGVPNLMSIWREKGVARGRVASLVESAMQVARLNGEAVRGLWASLSMELYYFANDDDERYSIQSNTSLLRNLMVQTAAPPLGYALYVCHAS